MTMVLSGEGIARLRLAKCLCGRRLKEVIGAGRDGWKEGSVLVCVMQGSQSAID